MTQPKPGSRPKNVVDPLADLDDSRDPEVQKAAAEHPENTLSDKPDLPPAAHQPEAASVADELYKQRQAELEAQLAEINKVPEPQPETAVIEDPEPRPAGGVVRQAPEDKFGFYDAEGRPKPDSELSEEQLRIRQLEHQLAVAAGRRDYEPEYEDTSGLADGERILIHVLEDGFTAQGQVWFRGQELEFVKGSRAYKDTLDRNGVSWLDKGSTTMKWGRGPWPGKPYEDDEAAQKERQRNRQAPVLPSL